MNAPASTTIAPDRVASIDVLRALTMVLMIFVNDFWTLTDIPLWLGHAPRGVDGMGLADLVFPSFLFIVGLSLPYAVDARRAKGDGAKELIGHILLRSIALIVMGVFFVNRSTFNAGATGLPRYLWDPLCCVCFILIWNSYPRSSRPLVVSALRLVGVLSLIFLGWSYRGGPDEAPVRLSVQWWGILGVIGWCYLVGGLVTVLARNSLTVVLAAWTFFIALSMAWKAQLIPAFFAGVPRPISGGTHTALVMGGLLTACVFRHYRAEKNSRRMTITLASFATVLLGLYFATRPIWGLSKIGATPAWLFLCSAISILAFLVLHQLVDIQGKAGWFSPIRPAGTDTLLCYLTPYLLYGLMTIIGLSPPGFMLAGGLGLLKSLLFALICVAVTAGLTRLGIRLKI